MVSASMTGTARIAEILCPEHRAAAEHCWPFATGHASLHCEDCDKTGRDRARAAGGELTLHALPHLERPPYFLLLAIHEAAHAVVAADVGHVVTSIHVYGRGAPAIGGGIFVEDWELPVHDHLAMVWAGQLAMARQLESLSATADDLVDCFWLAENDTNEARRWISEFDLPPEAGRRLAGKMIDMYWGKIMSLATLLEQRPSLEGPELQHALSLAS